MTRPWRQSGRYGSKVALATRGCLVDVLLQVVEQRLHLLVRPAVRDRRHLVPTLSDQLLEASALRQQGVVRDRRPETALPLQPMALRARAFPLAFAESVACGAEPGCVLRLRLHLDDSLHRRVENPAELAALPAVGAGSVGFEPCVRHVTRDRVELAAELWNP